MATRKSTTTRRTTKVKETGSAAISANVEKMTTEIEKAVKNLGALLENYDTKISEASTELNDMYFKAKAQEEEMSKDREEKEKAAQDLLTKLNNEYSVRKDAIQNEEKELRKSYEVKKRDFEIKLNQDLEESKLKTLEKLLKEFKLVSIEVDALAKLQNDLDTYKASFDANLKSEVSKSKAIIESKFNSKIEVAKLTHEREQAENSATIKQLRSQVEFLEQQLVKAENRLENVLNNQVEVARATKAVTINTDKK